MKPLKKNVSLTIDEDVDSHIRKLAEDSNRSFSQYINLVLKRHIEYMIHKNTKKFQDSTLPKDTAKEILRNI